MNASIFFLQQLTLLLEFAAVIAACILFVCLLLWIPWSICKFTNAITRCANCIPCKGVFGNRFRPLNQPEYKQIRILEKECNGVKKLVEEVAAAETLKLNEWPPIMAQLKFCVVRPQFPRHWGKCTRTAAVLLSSLRAPKGMLTFIGNREFAGRAWGYADKYYDEHDPMMVIGFESWFLRVGEFKIGIINLKPFRWFLWSSVLHEMEHCRQQVSDRQLMNRRWKKGLNTQEAFEIWREAESGAFKAASLCTLSLIGGGIVPLMIVVGKISAELSAKILQ